MKLNRFIALAVIALLAIGAMGLVSTGSFARTQSAPQQQVQTTSVAPAQDTVLEDPATGPDTDTIQEQVGDQVEDGQPDGTQPSGTDTGADEQSPSYTGSISIDQATTEGMSEADEASALAGQAKINVEEAKAAALAANPGTTVVKAELSDENGVLVYSVELSNGSDVKVDAGKGAVLHTDIGGDNQG
jgi:uncharacterized membrane protein YkoI